MSTWQERAKARMKELGLTQEDLTEPLGVKTRGAVGHYFSGRRNISLQQARALCDFLGVEFSKFFDGNDPAYLDFMSLKSADLERPAKTAINDEPKERLYGPIDAWDSKTPLGDDEVELPLYREVELSGGSGRTFVQENKGAKLRFARSTLARKGIDPANAACCFVTGDSMANVLPDGTTVAVDTSQKTIIDGKIYAFEHGGMLRIKYLHRIPGGRIKISSENAAYDDEFVGPEDNNDFRIIGRVFWYAVLL